MTVQEAIKILHPESSFEALLGYTREEGLKIVEEACVLACEALEKRIPKKVETWANGTHHCPNEDCYCNEFNLPYEHEFSYCPECGQKLDWSEEE